MFVSDFAGEKLGDLHGPKHTLGQIIKPRKQEECRHQNNGRTGKRSHLGTATGFPVDTRAGNRTIGGERTRNKSTCKIRGTESDKLSIRTDGVGITSSILLCGNDAVEKTNDGDESRNGCTLVIFENQS